MRRSRGGALLAGGVLTLTGCTLASPPDAPTTSAPAPTSATRPSSSRSVGLPPVDLPSTTVPRSCADRVLGAQIVHVRGSRGGVHWDLQIPRFSGAGSAAEVNRHVRASAQDAIDLGLREGADAGGRRDVEGEATVTTSDRRTVQVELRWTDYVRGNLYPNNHVATTVVTTDAGRPLRLRDVLADVPGGLRTIAKAIEPMAEPSEPSGLAPKEKHFAAWQTTGKGMRFTFEDYQLGGRGVRTYTVPWRTVRPLLSAYGTGLLDPDVDPSTC